MKSRRSIAVHFSELKWKYNLIDFSQTIMQPKSNEYENYLASYLKVNGIFERKKSIAVRFSELIKLMLVDWL